MFFDTIILFLNVLEQFAIRVTIFDFYIEDIIKYVNNMFFLSDDDIKNFVLPIQAEPQRLSFDSYVIVKNNYASIDDKIGNVTLSFKSLQYNNVIPSYRLIYV